MNHKNTATIPACPVQEASCDVIDQLVTLREQVEQLQSDVQTDALTGLYNYRYFEQMLSQEMERVRRSQLPLALVLADIDHFKRFNDEHGHEAGNRALVKVAEIIQEQVRQLDFACRFGGEEFALLLPATGTVSALRVSERIRAAVQNETRDLPEPLTLSLGVAVFTQMMNISQRELVITADKMLYASKHRGRNCVTGPEAETGVSNVFVTAEEKGALFGPADE